MVPVAVLPPATPATIQVTAALLEPSTVAVNCSVAPVITVADAGLTVTVSWMEITAAATLALFAVLTAVTVTLPPAGAVEGA